MLEQVTIEANKEKYLHLLSLAGILSPELTTYLEATQYFYKPASDKYFKTYPGGLCEHALKTAHELGRLCSAYYPGKYSSADILRVALLKDLYRAEMYECYQKNVKNEETGNWESVPAYRTKEAESRPTFGDLYFSSYMIARNFVPDLTDEQILAIVHSKPTDYAPDIHEIMRSFPLVTMVRMAETASMYIE